MRKLWWFVIAGGVVLAGLLIALGFAVFGDDGGSDATSEPCKPVEARSAGNANVRARALGNGFNRQIVIRVTDKQSGEPVQGAKVTVRGTMDCLPSGTPHFMPLLEKDLREASTGTYRGDYQLIMQGLWTFNVVVRSEQGGSTTAAFPVTVKTPG
jgi:YtkA-like